MKDFTDIDFSDVYLSEERDDSGFDQLPDQSNALTIETSINSSNHDSNSHHSNQDNEDSGATSPNHPPVYIPEDLLFPDEFELRESGVIEGLGVWTMVPVPRSQKFGPFAGVLKTSVQDPSSAWEVGVIHFSNFS